MAAPDPYTHARTAADAGIDDGDWIWVESCFMGRSFNTREFFRGKSRRVVQGVKWAFLVLAFPLPAALLLAGAGDTADSFAVLAFVIPYVGLIAERWFFFTQAAHLQNLYYQAAS